MKEIDELKKNPEYRAFEWLKQFTVPACEKIESQIDVQLGDQAKMSLEETLFARLSQLVQEAIGGECLRIANKFFNIPPIAYSLISKDMKCEIGEMTYNNLMDLDVEAVFNSNPALEEIITTVVEQYTAAMLEMFERISRHKTELEQSFLSGKEITVIYDISTAGADTHNNGRTTSRIVTNAGRFMYKPHDMGIDVFISSLFEQHFSDVVRVPAALTFTDDAGLNYGFAEYLVNTPANTMEQAKEYYFNLGGFTAITIMLGSDDLHLENILSVGDRPAVVDLEMMITPLAMSKELINHKLYYYSKSVYETKMFPTIIGNVLQTSPLVSTGENNESIPIVDGEKITVYRFLTDYFDGFTSIYRRIIERKESLRDYVMSADDFAVRVLSRATSTYQKILLKFCAVSLASKVSTTDKKIEDVVSGLLRGNSEIEEQGFILLEREQIKRFNIPYFYVGATSGIAYSEGRKADGISYHGSPVDAILDRLSLFNETGMNFNLRVMEYLLLEPTAFNTPDILANPLRVKGYSPEKLYLSIEERSVKLPNGKVLWISNHNGISNEPLREGLYYGNSGIAVIEAALVSVVDDEAIKDMLSSSIETYIEDMNTYIGYLEQEETLKYPFTFCGRSTGLAGVIDALVRIGNYLNEARCINLAERLVAVLNIYKWDDTALLKDISFKNGIAGCLYILCKYRDKLKITDGIIRKLADIVADQQQLEVDDGIKLWSTTGKNRAISGLDIGMGGIGLALMAASKTLDDKHLVDIANEAINYEKSAYNEKYGGWGDMSSSSISPQTGGSYHSGNPGMGMLWMALGEDELANKAIDAVVQADNLYLDRLENGNLAAIDFLIEAGEHYDRPELIELAKKKYDDIALRQRHYCGENRFQAFNPTLFAGDFGLLYIKLRCNYPNKISNILL